MKIPIVNEKDRVIGYKESNERNLLKEITRVSNLWIFDEKDRVLIAKRSKNKKALPNRWGTSVAGSVEKGETYESNIIKEAKEEIGLIISKSDLTLGPKERRTTQHAYFCQWFFLKIKSNTKFILQESEVDDIKWVLINDLTNFFHKEKENCIPNFNEAINIIKVYANKD